MKVEETEAGWDIIFESRQEIAKVSAKLNNLYQVQSPPEPSTSPTLHIPKETPPDMETKTAITLGGASVAELSNELFSRELTLDQALDIESKLYPLPGGDDGKE